MRAQRKDPPSWYDVLRSLTGVINPVLPTALSAAEGPIKKAIPANAAAMYKFATGDGETPMTEEYLNSSDIEVLQRAIAKAESEGRDYITYNDYAGTNDEEYPRAYTQGRFGNGISGREGYQDPSYRGINSLINMMAEPESRMLTTLGSAKFKKNEDGSYTITDNFDFNRGSEEARFVVKDLMERTGLGAEESMKRYLDNPILGTINMIRDGYLGPQIMNDGTVSNDPADRPLLYDFIRRSVAPVLQYQAAGGSSTKPAKFEGYGTEESQYEWAHPDQHTVRKGEFNTHAPQAGLPIRFNIPASNYNDGGVLTGDPTKKPSNYRDVLLASVDSTKAASIPPQMLDQMQSIVDRGNIMENRDQLKEILGVLVNDYGLDTSKLADGITQYKTDTEDLNWLEQKAERAKLGAGLTALGYANGGSLDTGDPKKEKKPESTGYAALDARLARLAAEESVSKPDTINYNTSRSDRLQRQIMAESSGNPNAVSPVGAKGLFQIMPATQKDLEDRGLIPAGLDPFNPDHSRQMRDAKINALSELQWIKNPPQHIPEKNRLARIYASYNWGEGNVRKALEKAKADGVDIYGDPDLWYSYLPAETSGYLGKILD